MGIETGVATVENSMGLLKKLKIELPYVSAISFLGIHPKELKAETQTDIYTHKFTAALFVIAKRWKQP